MEKKKKLSQYYSSAPISDLLVGSVEGVPSSVLDLAAGKGDLLLAAKRRFPSVEAFANDIDKENVTQYLKKVPEIHAFSGDALDSQALKGGVDNYSPYDLVVGNPPFGATIANLSLQQEIYEALGVKVSLNTAIRLEIAFLAKGIFYTSDKGYISIVLPRTLSQGFTHKKLRGALLKRHQLCKVIDLPKSSFVGTEVETTIWVIKKGIPTVDDIQIQLADHEGRIVGDISVDPDAAVNRLDFNYNSWRLENNSDRTVRLKDLGGSVDRGSVYYSKARNLGLKVFHTSHFKLARNGIMHFKNWAQGSSMDGLVCVQKNDILIPRVGRALASSALVGSGQSPISDCVYRVRIPARHVVKVKESLQTESARSWIEAHASGSCAKIISKSMVLEMPVFT